MVRVRVGSWMMDYVYKSVCACISLWSAAIVHKLQNKLKRLISASHLKSANVSAEGFISLFMFQQREQKAKLVFLVKKLWPAPSSGYHNIWTFNPFFLFFFTSAILTRWVKGARIRSYLSVSGEAGSRYVWVRHLGKDVEGQM